MGARFDEGFDLQTEALSKQSSLAQIAHVALRGDEDLLRTRFLERDLCSQLGCIVRNIELDQYLEV